MRTNRDSPGRPRTALVTGASRGIGYHTALAMAADGFDVAFTARTIAEGTGRVVSRTGSSHDSIPVAGSLELTRARIEDLGRRALPLPMDLLSQRSVTDAVTTVLDEWGTVDVVVNNAIAHLPGAHSELMELSVESLMDLLRANFVNQLHLVQLLVPRMVQAGGGLVVNMYSGSATTPPPAPPGQGGWGLGYASSKAAFGRIVGSLNAEYATAGIRAFNVDPGFVLTDASRARGGADVISDQGFASAAETATGRVVCWLASDPDADRFLGKVVWAPKLAAELDAATS